MTDAKGEMCFGWAADTLLLIAHTKKSPEPATWSTMCRALADRVAARGVVRTIVFTDGGGPASAQREEMAGLLERSKYRTSVFTTAPTVRFIVSSLAFINPAIKAYHPNEWERGLEHLSVSPAERRQVEQAVQDFAKRHGDRFATLNAVLSPGGRRATGT